MSKRLGLVALLLLGSGCIKRAPVKPLVYVCVEGVHEGLHCEAANE